MRSVRILLLAATAVVGFGATGFAADLPVYKAAPRAVVTAYNWTGFYIGANLGWGWTDGSGTATIGGVTAPYSGSGNGFLGGVQLGYNWQAGPIVFGVETDFQGSSGDGTVIGPAATGARGTVATAETPWFGTIRGRIGYAFDRTLLYVTGGGLYGKANLDGTSAGVAFSSSARYWSWTLGAGIEQAMWDRWTAKLEYLYVGDPSNAPVPPLTAALSGSSDTHILRVGLNYHF